MQKVNPTFTKTGTLNEFNPKCSRCNDTGLVIATEKQINDPNIVKIIDTRTELVSGEFVDTEILKVDCVCVVHKNMITNLNRSGLRDVVEKYTFDNYKTYTDYRKRLKSKCVEFSKEPGAMLAFLGQSGLGKTHLCSATTIELMRKNYIAHYMIWTEEVDKAKANYHRFDDDYLHFLKTVPVLYIDDFLKTRDNKGKIDDFVFNAAFSILNKRKEDKKLITILSSELSLGQILKIDTAIGGRVKEMSGKYLLDVEHKKDGNHRMRME